MQRLAIRMAVLLTAVGLTLASWSVHATTLKVLSLEDLTYFAQTVVVGSVSATRTHLDSQGRIVRSLTFEVAERVFGKAGESVTVRLQGGVLDGKGRHVPGELDLPEDEEMLLFLEPVPAEENVFVVVGMVQGRFRVVEDPQLGTRFVSRALSGANFSGETGDRHDLFQIARPHTSVYVPLELFVETVREIRASFEN